MYHYYKMGCKFCRNIHLDESKELCIKECNQDSLSWSEAMADFKLESINYHNIVKNSLPYHVKLATDRGKPTRPLINKIQDDSNAGIKKPHEELLYKKSLTIYEHPSQMDASKKDCIEPVGNFNFPQKSHLEIPKRNESQASICSYVSCAFDPECLVLENTKSIFEHYKTVESIGHGSFGIVKKVINKASNKVYALKIIKKKYCEKIGDINNEISILKKLVSTFVIN